MDIENKEKTDTKNNWVFFLGLLIFVFVTIWILTDGFRDMEASSLEAEKFYTTLVTPENEISCEPIPRINNGIPLVGFTCYGTSSCSGVQNERGGLTVFNNFTGLKVFSIYKVKNDRNIDKYLSDRHMRYEEYKGFCYSD